MSPLVSPDCWEGDEHHPFGPGPLRSVFGSRRERGALCILLLCGARTATSPAGPGAPGVGRRCRAWQTAHLGFLGPLSWCRLAWGPGVGARGSPHCRKASGQAAEAGNRVCGLLLPSPFFLNSTVTPCRSLLISLQSAPLLRWRHEDFGG